MIRSFLFTGLLCWGSSFSAGLHAQSRPTPPPLYRLHQQALKLYNSEPQTPATDSLSLRYFKRIVAELPPTKENAGLLLSSYTYAGILLQTASRHQEALTYYQGATATGIRFNQSDSVLFKPYLYSGSVHYLGQAFDSSSYYFKKAEQIYRRYPTIDEGYRLYNSFGILLYEAGNYQQSINYFRKALQLNAQKGKEDIALKVFYTSNIASALRHLEQYDSAAVLYKTILPYPVKRNELLINLATTYLEKKDATQALSYLMSVKSLEAPNRIPYQNALARAYFIQKRYEEARASLISVVDYYSQQAKKKGMVQKNTYLGRSYKLLGDIHTDLKDYPKALAYYQRAIVAFDHNFNDLAIDKNPSPQNEGFSSFVLFETIAAKAHCQQLQLSMKQNPGELDKVAGTYRSALELSGYIQRVFDTEEARLFALRKIAPVQQKAIRLFIQLYQRTGNISYLNEAFLQCERSKAAVLSIGQTQNEIKATAGVPASLLQQERNLRFTLSQLFIRQEKAKSDEQYQKLRQEILDANLALSRLEERLNEYPEYYRRKFNPESLTVEGIQKNSLSSSAALISYYQTQQTVYAFVLTTEGLSFYATPYDATFRNALKALVQNLRHPMPGQAYRMTPVSKALYNSLILPLESALVGKQSLLIIPHNELTPLSFDVLENADQQYLIERFDITYQYSASFLKPRPKMIMDPLKMLGVAPFVAGAALGNYRVLPGSEAEVNSLVCTKLIGNQATKDRFLDLAREATVIHLSTHALANNENPAQSYISFSPQPGKENKLYAHELQYGNLGNTQLFFLSACESGAGMLIGEEGIMSLSRALSYAGCPSLITSLWNAEDKVTAYIGQQFYKYVSEGETIANALRLSKLDLLKNPSMAQYHAPPYWSNLVYVGSPPQTLPPYWPGIVGAIAFLIFLYVFVRLRLKARMSHLRTHPHT